MKTRTALLAQIKGFLDAHRMTEHRFGLLAVNDHKFVDRLRRNSVTLDRIERAERFMATYGKESLLRIDVVRVA